MNSGAYIRGLPGGRELIDWFGRVPRFHDAELLRIDLASGSGGSIQIHTWNLTGDMDAGGFYVTDKHALVTIDLVSVQRVNLSEFHQTGIINRLEVEETGPETEVSWTSSCGVEGSILAETVMFQLSPGRPTPVEA